MYFTCIRFLFSARLQSDFDSSRGGTLYGNALVYVNNTSYARRCGRFPCNSASDTPTQSRVCNTYGPMTCYGISSNGVLALLLSYYSLILIYMALNIQRVCNNCGQLLYGKNGTRWTKKPHIYIKGRIALQNLGEEARQYHAFVTKDDEEETTVCDAACLGEYCETRRTQYKQNREQKLRQEANNNFYLRD